MRQERVEVEEVVGGRWGRVRGIKKREVRLLAGAAITNLHVIGWATKYHLAGRSLFLFWGHFLKCFVAGRHDKPAKRWEEHTKTPPSMSARLLLKRLLSTRRTSEEVHGVLSDVTSKAMRRKLAAQGSANLPTIPTENSNNVSPFVSPPPAYSQPQGLGFFQLMMVGGGVTLGFILVGSVLKAIGLEKAEGKDETALFHPPLK